MQHKRGNDIINQYNYNYNPAQMIKSITRKQQTGTSGAKMTFAYDKIYQLTSESGNYITDFSVPSASSVANKFNYDSVGNRISDNSPFSKGGEGDLFKTYSHTPDNQLTEISWNSDKVTLGGEIQQAWTANYVKVKQDTASTWTLAEIKCNSPFSKGGKGDFKKGNIKWTASNVPFTGTGNITFQIECQTPETTPQIITETVNYNKTSTSPSGSITYQYDNCGNRTRKTDENNKITTYTYDDENQLTDINGYDKNGTHFVYSYKYDPFGRRIKATEKGVSRYFAFDGLDNIAEMKIASSKLQIEKYYTSGSGLGGGIGDIVSIVNCQLSTINYLHYNHRGDVVLTTDESGNKVEEYEYDAFGLPITDQPITDNRFIGFSSKEFDKKSGLSYYGFRFYDSESGRWMKKDPILWEGGLNLYGFCLNNPIKNIDVYGLINFDSCHECENSFAECYKCVNIKFYNHLKDKLGSMAGSFGIDALKVAGGAFVGALVTIGTKNPAAGIKAGAIVGGAVGIKDILDVGKDIGDIVDANSDAQDALKKCEEKN